MSTISLFELRAVERRRKKGEKEFVLVEVFDQVAKVEASQSWKLC